MRLNTRRGGKSSASSSGIRDEGWDVNLGSAKVLVLSEEILCIRWPRFNNRLSGVFGLMLQNVPPSFGIL